MSMECDSSLFGVIRPPPPVSLIERGKRPKSEPEPELEKTEPKPKPKPKPAWRSKAIDDLTLSDFSMYDNDAKPFMFMCAKFTYRNKAQIKKEKKIKALVADYKKRSRNVSVFDAITPPRIAEWGKCWVAVPLDMDDDLRHRLIPLCKLALDKYNVDNQAANFVFLDVVKTTWSAVGILEAQKTPAIYVFGDSLVDVGNNNYLSLSLVKATLPHYGIDFPTKKPTGRFSNGKNAADLIAEKLGLATSPPYLSLISKFNKKNVSFLGGVNFASGGAGIFNRNDRQAIPLTKQVDYYTQVHDQLTQQVGASTLQNHLSKSIFGVVIGSNDIFGYYNSMDLQKKNTPQQYADSMVSSLKIQLQRLYNNGARKFEIIGVSTIGCVPALRLKNKTECFSEANLLSIKYNEGLQSMLKELKLENKYLSYSYFDTYGALQDLIQNPISYGFADVKDACCGLGMLNAQFLCTPISGVCSNRQDHIFWDQFHPTEAASRTIVDKLYNGPSKYTSPINLEQLLAL